MGRDVGLEREEPQQPLCECMQRLNLQAARGLDCAREQLPGEDEVTWSGRVRAAVKDCLRKVAVVEARPLGESRENPVGHVGGRRLGVSEAQDLRRRRSIEQKPEHPLRERFWFQRLLAVEPPDHTRYRKTVSAVFTSRAVARLRDGVEQTASRLLDQLADQSGGSGVVDMVERYCSQLPVAIISDILGVPEQDRRHVLEFGELAAPSLDFGVPWRQYRRVQDGLAGFSFWLADHLEHLRRNPGGDLMSQLIQTAESGSAETHLDKDELQALAGLVLAAGFETTVNLLGNGIRMLLDMPEHLETLRQRPELWPNAVEEILRLDSPVQLTARLALNDVELAGRPIKRGELVVVYLAAANRDPEVFPDPHRFDIERSNAGKHLAFSGGRHFCLGAALARAEGEVGLRTFFDRFPEVRAAGTGSRRETRVLRGWSTLPVTLGPARSMVAP